MQLKSKIKIIFLLAGLTIAADDSFGRSVYMNGIDISSATGQELKGVNIHIDGNGDIFITAPQYEVFQEDRFLPFSSYGMGKGGIEHSKRGPLPKYLSNTGNTRPLPPTETTAKSEMNTDMSTNTPAPEVPAQEIPSAQTP